MEKPKISIIVPIYNMEMYLRECLDSIKRQTFTDWECILVDDGSNDSSPTICDEYSALDARFKTVHKKNGGVSSARNVGLHLSKADFVGFVDPDDWADPELFKHLYMLINNYEADIAQVGYWREYIGRKTVKHHTKDIHVIDGATATQEIAFDRLHNYLWNKLHRKEIINCDFPEGRVFEDIFAYGHWLKNVRKMVIDPIPLYHYRMRKGSIVHDSRYRYDFFLSCIDKIKMMHESMQGEEDVKYQNAFINKSAINASKMIARQEINSSIREQTILKISDKVNEYPLPSIRYLGLKMWNRAIMLRRHPKFFSLMMRLVHMFDLDSKHRDKQLFS